MVSRMKSGLVQCVPTSNHSTAFVYPATELTFQ